MMTTTPVREEILNEKKKKNKVNKIISLPIKIK